ncbi:MAG TPA: chloride channel protein, partial [Gammaproteobacteria bacterium]
LGAVGLGIIGYFVPRVLGVGYETISDILNNHLGLSLLLLILVFKTLALLISLGSGTSGGLLAPMFMGGAALGGSFAIIINHVVPGAHLDPSAYAVVGMAAVFAAASRATFTFIIFAFEITRNYNAVLPLMLVCVIANAIGLLYLRESIMTEKLARRGLKIHLEYEVDVLHQVTVGEVMDRQPVTLPAATTLSELITRLNGNDAALMRHNAYLLLNDDGKLEGILTRGDVFRAVAAVVPDSTRALDIGRRNPVYACPGDTLNKAAHAMLHHNVGRLPVVDPLHPDTVLGYLGRSAVLEARQRRISEESQVETGWLFKLNRNRNHAEAK